VIPAILRPLDTLPEFGDGTGDEGLSNAFKALSRLFVYLEGDFTTAASGQALSLERHKVASYQANLSLIPDDAGASSEAQQVDLFVTRQWIRLLLWEYTSRHFAMACWPADQAFCLFLPVKISHELLSLFSMVPDAAVKTHGYGMVSGFWPVAEPYSGLRSSVLIKDGPSSQELKVFRLADALLDLIACSSASARCDAMLVTSGEVLHSFRRVLAVVGGRDSIFLRKLHGRMSELELDMGAWPYRTLLASQDGVDEDDDGGGF
jgi:hypothetical protein